jgi:hypothetical protein
MCNSKKICSIQIIYVPNAVKPVENREGMYVICNEVFVLDVGHAM